MSTFWIYIRIQLMIFVFGIVGPIFLFVYFVSQPEPTLKWMYWWGLFITTADVLIALSLTGQTVKADRAELKRKIERDAD
ncbi:MAG: hypothetical protein HYZ38_28745 [Mycobacterium sp.]|nr:hypothetical protein [Mycobacterium sp.]